MIIYGISYIPSPIIVRPSYKLISPRELIKRLKGHKHYSFANIYPDAILIPVQDNPLMVTWSDPFFMDEVVRPIMNLELKNMNSDLSYNRQLTHILKQL